MITSSHLAAQVYGTLSTDRRITRDLASATCFHGLANFATFRKYHLHGDFSKDRSIRDNWCKSQHCSTCHGTHYWARCPRRSENDGNLRLEMLILAAVAGEVDSWLAQQCAHASLHHLFNACHTPSDEPAAEPSVPGTSISSLRKAWHIFSASTDTPIPPSSLKKGFLTARQHIKQVSAANPRVVRCASHGKLQRQRPTPHSPAKDLKAGTKG